MLARKSSYVLRLEKLGYQLGGRVRGYYHGSLDAYSMVKRLDEARISR